MNKTKNNLQMPVSSRDFNRIYLKGPKNSSKLKSKENKEIYQMKLAQNQRYFGNVLNTYDNINLDSYKFPNKSQENFKELLYKDKKSNLSNNIDKRCEISSIFDVKKLSQKNNDFELCSSRTNIRNNFAHSKRVSPQAYQLSLNNNYSNNSLYIGNKIKTSENKSKKKSNFGIYKDKNKEIDLDNITNDIDKKYLLNKISNNRNYTSNNYYNNNHAINNYTYNEYNYDKIKKFKSNKQSIKLNSNNKYSFQCQSPRNILNNKNEKSLVHSNATKSSKLLEFQKNYNLHNLNYQIESKGSNKNLFKEFSDVEKDKNNNLSKGFDNTKMKNNVNNNNISINNVYINLDNKNKTYFNKNFKPLLNDDLCKFSISDLSNFININLNHSNNPNIDINQILKEIKYLWREVGGVSEHYKIFFLGKLNYLNNEGKYYFYLKEKEELINILNLVQKLNNDIQARENINLQLKNMTVKNYLKIEEISQLLISLRLSTINFFNDFINFKKEISFDLLNNKYILNNICNYPFNYLNVILNDTLYLSSHELLSTLYNFSNFPDPFLLKPSKKNEINNCNILPLEDSTFKEIQKIYHFILKEIINEEDKRNRLAGNSKNYCNNAILIRNNNGVKKMDNKKNIQIITKSNRFNKITLCSNISNFSIHNNNEKENKNKNIVISKSYNFEIKKEEKNDKIICPCSKVVDLEIQYNKNDNTKKDNFSINNISNFEIKSILPKNNKPSKPEKKRFNENIDSCSKVSTFEIINLTIKNNINKNETKDSRNRSSLEIPQKSHSKNSNSLKDCSEIKNSQKNDQNKEEIAQKSKENETKPIPPSVNQVICPYNPKNDGPIEEIYSEYLKSVNDDIKLSFKINPDIFYYATLGVSPKIILFKQNGSIYGLATLSFDPSQILCRSLMITSISCSKDFSLIKTLLQLVSFCNRNIEYDDLILSLYFSETEETGKDKDKYVLNEEYKNLIKTQTKFKWIALENTGNERRIKYLYKKPLSSKKSILPHFNDSIKVVKNYTQIRFYRFVKYNETNCEKGLNAKEYTSLFNVLELIVKYGKDINDENDELNVLFSKMSGLKKKRLIKMISEFNNVMYNKPKAFMQELSEHSDKIYSELLLKKFVPLVKSIEKKKYLGLYYCDISTNFSSILKKRINGFEYNIISINNFNIEVFRLSNEKENEDFNNYLYFFKSENESVSFILYELSSVNEKDMESNEKEGNNTYKNEMFNKLLKRILTKDNDEPAKLYKKIGIPSFRYHPIFQNEEKSDQNKLSDYDILDGDDWFDFCIENNTNECIFSFPEQKNENEEEIKIIENSFVIAIINPDLTVDYHIPALNIYYINKKCWIPR